MPTDPSPQHGIVDGVEYEVRPEWLAGRNWWRVYVARSPEVLLRSREYAIRVAEVLALDEALCRQQAGSSTDA